MDLISRTDLMNDLDTSVVFSGRTHEPGEHNSEVVGAQKVINRIETAPEVKAIPIEWVKKYLAKLIVVKDDLDYPNQLLIGRVIGIEIMLEEWEKENEPQI